MPRPRTSRRAVARSFAITAVVVSLPCLAAATTRPTAGTEHSASVQFVLGPFAAPFAVRTSVQRASRDSARAPLTALLSPAAAIANPVLIAKPVLRATGPQAADPKIASVLRPAGKTATTKPAAKVSPAWVRPNGGPPSSPFGRRWGRMHSGIDLAGGYGSPILAAAAGVVTYAGPEEGFGRIVKITEPDGTQTWYGHMSHYLVKAGDHVSAGERIALVGSAGDATGPHLHFEVHVGGQAIDPLPFLRAHGVRI